MGPSLRQAKNTRIWRPKYDLAKIMAPAGKALVGAKMREYQPPFTSYVQGILERFFAQEPAGPRAEYIPESVWELRRAKLALKARSRHRADLWSSLVTRAFGQWRCSVDMGVARLVRRQGLLYQLVSTAIGIATAAIKRGIKEAKAVTCGGSRAAVGRTRQTSWATSKKIGLGGAKAKTAGRQLPALIDATGCPVRTRQDRDKLWLTHFGKQELGHIEKVSDFLEQEHSTVVQGPGAAVGADGFAEPCGDRGCYQICPSSTGSWVRRYPSGSVEGSTGADGCRSAVTFGQVDAPPAATVAVAGRPVVRGMERIGPAIRPICP